MVRDPRLVAQVLELRHEADIYHHLRKNDCADVVPTFFGFSESAGVLCLEFEGEDFEDIGEENLPVALKLSAVDAIQRISQTGVLHGDLALRNIVRSKEHPNRAKIIDFGRARVTKNKLLLENQVSTLRRMLGVV